MKRMPPKAARFWIVTACVFGIVVYCIGTLANRGLIVGAGGVIIAGAFIFSVICYRCSHCGKHLGRSSGDYCPYCGKELQEERE